MNIEFFLLFFFQTTPDCECTAGDVEEMHQQYVDFFFFSIQKRKARFKALRPTERKSICSDSFIYFFQRRARPQPCRDASRRELREKRKLRVCLEPTRCFGFDSQTAVCVPDDYHHPKYIKTCWFPERINETRKKKKTQEEQKVLVFPGPVVFVFFLKCSFT